MAKPTVRRVPTAYSYINRGTETCRIAFVLIDAEQAD
jgi:hypothetical protein